MTVDLTKYESFAPDLEFPVGRDDIDFKAWQPAAEDAPKSLVLQAFKNGALLEEVEIPMKSREVTDDDINNLQVKTDEIMARIVEGTEGSGGSTQRTS